MSYTTYHRRRKILKVGWAQYPVVREIFTTMPILCQTMPIFARLRPYAHAYKYLGVIISCLGNYNNNLQQN